MKQCKSRTGMLVPCIAYKGIWSALSGDDSLIAGSGYIIYNAFTMQLMTSLADDNGVELPPNFYSIKQEYDKAFLVVYSEKVM